jgi:hypothetical protein
MKVHVWLTAHLDQSRMPSEQYRWLISLHSNGELLRPEAPASSFVKLAVGEIPKDLNGRVVAWDDGRVTSLANPR